MLWNVRVAVQFLDELLLDFDSFISGNSFPSIMADMLSDAIGCVGFSWVSPRPSVRFKSRIIYSHNSLWLCGALFKGNMKHHSRFGH